jgi:hypothetical protein
MVSEAASRLLACQALAGWLCVLPGVSFSSSIEPADRGEKGLGLLLPDGAARGDVLVVLPASICLSASSALASPTLGPKMRASPVPVREDDAIALLLLEERALGSASERSLHVASLPLSHESTLFWSDDELKELQASPLRRITEQLLLQTEGDWAELCSAGLGGDHSLADYRWALATVWSRGMDLPCSATDPSARLRLVAPFLDLANSDASLPVCHALELGTGSVVFIAGRDYTPGSELCINYGVCDSHRSLRVHGFLPRCAAVSLPFFAELDDESEAAATKRSLLQSAGVSRGQQHSLTLAQPAPEALLTALRILHLPPAEASRLAASAEGVPVGVRLGPENEIAAVGALSASTDSQCIVTYQRQLLDLW